MNQKTQYIIVTGMSGAGKTVAMQCFEDLGYFCIDNMPPTLFDKLDELVASEDTVNKVALVIDLRSQVFYDEFIKIYEKIIDFDNTDVLFLEANDAQLVSRYKETRRNHPLSRNGRLIDGISRERELLTVIKQQADLVIDTTNLSPRQLRKEILHAFKPVDKTTHIFHIELMSFGFKYGLPIDADITMDVRFLPNPYYIDSMKSQTGLQEAVSEYVMKSDGAQEFYDKLIDLIRFTLPGYQQEGKTNLTIAIGCTGGQHRSVAIAQRLFEDLKDDYPVNITHRDINNHKRGGNPNGN